VCDISIIWPVCRRNQVKGFIIVETNTTPAFSVEKDPHKISRQGRPTARITLARTLRLLKQTPAGRQFVPRDRGVLRMTPVHVGCLDRIQMGAFRGDPNTTHELLQFLKPIASFSEWFMISSPRCLQRDLPAVPDGLG